MQYARRALQFKCRLVSVTMRAKLKKSLKNYSFFWGSISYFENASGRRPKSGWPRVAYDGGSGVSMSSLMIPRNFVYI